MKLYTEEQVKKMIYDGNNIWYGYDAIISRYTPIELPSDEEIEEEAEEVYPISKEYKEKLGANNYDDFNDCWNEGAKWMKEQILNQNK